MHPLEALTGAEQRLDSLHLHCPLYDARWQGAVITFKHLVGHSSSYHCAQEGLQWR